MSQSGTAGTPRFDFAREVPEAADLGRVHFVAIGGAGVSSVALAYLEAGHEVSGSDQRDSPVLATLRQAGATVFVGHDSAHLTDADTVIISGAVPETNPEVLEARERGIPVLHRAQGIAALGASRDMVAVAGANGKTTTSAMVVAALDAGRLDPGYVIGSAVVASGRSASVGTGPLVIEADESDGSFVTYRPRVAIVTNVMADHLDFFGDFAGVQRAYQEFVDSVRPDGLVVLNADDDGARELASYAAHHRRTVTWGESADADVQLSQIERSGTQVAGTLCWPIDKAAVGSSGTAVDSTRLRVPMPGLHNLSNAAAAVVAAVIGYQVSPSDAAAGLAGFGGTRRRFELIGEVNGIRVIDDYAHNPAKVAAVVQAGLAAAGGSGRVVVVFQPHLYSRTRDFATQFADALRMADLVLVLPVYGAREDPIAGVGAHTIVDLLAASAPVGPGLLLPASTMPEAAGILNDLLKSGDVVLTVGAGDVTALGPMIVEGLKRGQRRG